MRTHMLVQAVHLLFLAVLTSRDTNLERHTSPFIMSTHLSARGLQPLSSHAFSSTTSNTPCFPSVLQFLSSFVIQKLRGRSTCRRNLYIGRRKVSTNNSENPDAEQWSPRSSWTWSPSTWSSWSDYSSSSHSRRQSP